MAGKTLTIGKLSKLTGCSIETIRYYERIGLLANPPRSEGGHRLYERDHIRQLAFVQRSRGLGFTLEQIRQLFSHIDGAKLNCGQAKSMALAHVEEVREKIVELKRMEQQLIELVSQCSGGAVSECRAAETLFQR